FPLAATGAVHVLDNGCGRTILVQRWAEGTPTRELEVRGVAHERFLVGTGEHRTRFRMVAQLHSCLGPALQGRGHHLHRALGKARDQSLQGSAFVDGHRVQHVADVGAVDRQVNRLGVGCGCSGGDPYQHRAPYDGVGPGGEHTQLHIVTDGERPPAGGRSFEPGACCGGGRSARWAGKGEEGGGDSSPGFQERSAPGAFHRWKVRTWARARGAVKGDKTWKSSTHEAIVSAVSGPRAGIHRKCGGLCSTMAMKRTKKMKKR